MGVKMFARGYEASREEKQRQDRARENMGKKLWRFFLANDGDEADLRFLTEEPVNFYEHTLKRGDRYEAFTCTGSNCPFCDEGEKATYKGAYLIVDKREFEYTDKEGKKKTGKDQVRLFVQGMKVVSQLDRISDKYGLSNRDVTIVRLGKGTQTTYTIERGEEEKLSKKEIESLLPEKLRESYDGTMDSLMSIIEEQLLMYTKDYSPEEEDEDDDRSSKIIKADEDEEPFVDKESTKKRLFRKSENRVKNLLTNN